MVSTTAELLQDWYTALDEAGRAEARHCLVTGTWSRPLLTSLRGVLAPAAGHRRGLEDPHVAQRGEPLGANLQTFLRDRLLTTSLAGTGGIPVQRSLRTR